MSSTERPELARTSLSSRISGALPTTGQYGNSGERARRSPTASYPAAAAASTYSIGGVSGNVGGESATRLRVTGTRSYTFSRAGRGVPLGIQFEEALMIFELRQYHVRPGQREKWVKCMEEEIIPFQVKMGMVILGSFVGEEDESVYVWIRRFESEAERKRLYDLVYQSDYWKTEIAPNAPTLIDREQIKVTRLVATPRSVIQ